MDLPPDGYFSASYSLNVSPGAIPYEYAYGPLELTAGMKRVVERQYERIAAMPDWAGTFYGSTYFYGSLKRRASVAPAQLECQLRHQYHYGVRPGDHLEPDLVPRMAGGVARSHASRPAARDALDGPIREHLRHERGELEQQVVLDWTQLGGGVYYRAETGHATRTAAARGRVAGLVR